MSPRLACRFVPSKRWRRLVRDRPSQHTHAVDVSDTRQRGHAIGVHRGDRAPPWRVFLTAQPQVLPTNNLVLRDGVVRAAQARGDIAGAIQIYPRLLAYGPEQKWVSVFEPRYVLQLARLLERTGDKQGAQEEYRRFLALWRQADADLPELAEARRVLLRIE